MTLPRRVGGRRPVVVVAAAVGAVPGRAGTRRRAVAVRGARARTRVAGAATVR